MTFVKSTKSIPAVALFKYFEVEVISNSEDKPIYIGFVDTKDTFKSNPANWTEIGGPNSIVINGGTGEVRHGNITFKLDANLSLNEAGDTIGVCFHLQSADGQAEDLSIKELEKDPKKKKEDVLK